MQHFDPTLLSFFQTHNLSYEYFEHAPIFTVAEGEALKQSLPGLQTKNLFLTDKRGQYRLVCVESSKRLQINQFRKLVGAKDMTFATPEDMKEILGLTPGSVSIFGLVNAASYKSHLPAGRQGAIEQKDLQRIDGDLQPKLYLDRELWEAEKVGRHPNRNDATIVITHETLVKFLEIVGIEVKVVEIGEEMKGV